MNEPVAPAARYRSLDHWRGFAALWVVVFHAFGGWLVLQPKLLPAWVTAFVCNGWLAVHVFFVVSGYCITERAFREYRAGGSVTGFVADRLLRIYPPFWAALGLAVTLNIAGALAKHEPLLAQGLVPVRWEWLTAGLTAAHWLGLPSFLLVAWTLSYEIGFYLIAAAGLGLALRTRRPWMGFAWGAMLLLASLGTTIARWLPLLAFWPGFALGGVVWLLQHQVHSFGRRLLAGTLILMSIYAAGCVSPDGLPGMHFLFACGCSWLMMVLQPMDLLISGFAGLHWLGWAGTFSYSIYLVHAPLISRTHNLLCRWHAIATTEDLLLQSAACLVTVAFAWLFYRLVEVRCEIARRVLIKKLRARIA